MAGYLRAYRELTRGERGAAAKFAILRSYSCEVLKTALTVDMIKRGMAAPEFFFGGYGRYAQEILDADGPLYQYAPEITLVAVNIEDLVPDVFDRYYLVADREGAVSAAVAEFARLAGILRERAGGTVVVTNFCVPRGAHYAGFQAQRADGIPNLVAKANLQLAGSLAGTGVYILDVQEIIRRVGANHAYDAKTQAVAGNPYAFVTYAMMSRNLTDMLSAIEGRRKKCIVLDLDGTLWKGVAGEDGPDGIEIDGSFRLAQIQLRHWYDTGILLAVCSKNNPDDALDIIRNHPDILLREEHFAALRLNWESKPDNIVSIADELNIGVDSMVFIDDSEFECGLVRDTLPSVETIWLNGDSAAYAELIKNIRSLDFVDLTFEDRTRNADYAAQKRRVRLMESSADVESYLRGLGMSAVIAAVDEYTLGRAAQLTQKTNQFNLTTRRYTAERLKETTEHGCIALTLKAADRYGDSGITGLMIIDTAPADQGVWSIDTFLLSCRVMGRELERAFMSAVISRAAAQGIKTVCGRYIPTSKNMPVKDLYGRLGFTRAGEFPENGATGERWEYDTGVPFAAPDYIHIETESGSV